MSKLYNFKDYHDNNYSLISEDLNNVVSEHSQEIEDMICHDRDYLIDYFGLKHLNVHI